MPLKKLDRFPVGKPCLFYRWHAEERFMTGVIVRNDGETVDVELEDGTLCRNQPSRMIQKYRKVPAGSGVNR